MLAEIARKTEHHDYRKRIAKLGYKKKTKIYPNNGFDFYHDDESRDYLVHLSNDGKITIVDSNKSQRKSFANVEDLEKFKDWHNEQ